MSWTAQCSAFRSTRPRNRSHSWTQCHIKVKQSALTSECDLSYHVLYRSMCLHRTWYILSTKGRTRWAKQSQKGDLTSPSEQAILMNSFYANKEFPDGAWLYRGKKQQAQSSWRNPSLLNKPWQQPPTVKMLVIRMCIKTLTLSSCKMDQTTTLSAVCIQRLICPVLHLKGDNYMRMGTGRAVCRTTMSQYICIKPCKALGRCLRVSLNPTVSWKLADDRALLPSACL